MTSFNQPHILGRVCHVLESYGRTNGLEDLVLLHLPRLQTAHLHKLRAVRLAQHSDAIHPPQLAADILQHLAEHECVKDVILDFFFLYCYNLGPLSL